MTSSLVGSEMCIRDRHVVVLFWQSVQSAKDAKRSQRHEIDDHATPSGSVSYTHLTLPTICSV
eukprot:973043-Prorocentrum_lima.AAC.1